MSETNTNRPQTAFVNPGSLPPSQESVLPCYRFLRQNADQILKVEEVMTTVQVITQALCRNMQQVSQTATLSISDIYIGDATSCEKCIDQMARP